MKNNHSTLYRLVCIVLFTSFSIALKAMPLGDTTKSSAAVANALPATEVMPLETNAVIYPKTLSSHKEQTLDYVQKFSEKRREYLIRTYKAGKKIFPKVVTVLNRFNLPQELKVLIALESGFNPNAVSPVGAMGYWQIMDDVAREYGLHIAASGKTVTKSKKKDKDDRTNFAKSTLVAARYLHDRCRNLNNDLLLIVASYNWGVGNVWRAMERTGKSNPSFWDIKKYLPAETKAYVMNFITLNVIFNNYDKFVKNQLVFNAGPDLQSQTAGESFQPENMGVVTF